MKEIPILFSTPMVQAILQGRKTQMRRIVKPAIGWDKEWHVQKIKEEHKDGINRYEMRQGTKYALPYFKCPYGQPGDLIWVREKHCIGRIDEEDVSDGHKGRLYVSQCSGDRDYIPYEYCTSNDISIDEVTWKPSIHMPKEAARIWLEVTDVRVERLQDISEDDAKAEGVEPYGDSGFYNRYTNPGDWVANPQASFFSLWESINGRESLNANPFVWAVSFKVLSTTGKPETLTQTTTNEQ